MLQKENQWFVLHFGTNHIVHKNLTIYFLSRSIFVNVSGQKRGSKPVRFSSSPHHTSEGREDIFFCAVKTGHEKSPETAWFRAFSVRYLFWSHNLVAGAGFEPTTSGLWEPESTGKAARKAKARSTSSAVYDDELTTASFYASFFNAFLGLARSTTALSGREKQIAGKYAGEALSGKLQEKQLISSTVDFISQFPGDFEHDI